MGTLVGLAPRVILVAVAGAGLSELDFTQGKNQLGLLLGIIATLISVIVIGKIARGVLQKMIKEDLKPV